MLLLLASPAPSLALSPDRICFSSPLARSGASTLAVRLGYARLNFCGRRRCAVFLISILVHDVSFFCYSADGSEVACFLPLIPSYCFDGRCADYCCFDAGAFLGLGTEVRVTASARSSSVLAA
ncbi:hypothetical protein BS78_K103300 [Paspalum vaginatum]|uniref:Uncharacterized protein n=1 Tax=Paspalum vaginatum TaxID=158149 RepID=A0A9W7X8U1_9POAL|nr:hypothetical protein BS78_K103300 [Paspalum vaginatum]